MRHHDRKRKLGRVKRQRGALVRSLARSLLISGGIVTTVAKAKELRPFVEQLVTVVKQKGSSSRQILSKRIGSSREIEAALSKISDRYAKRQGGYTRIVNLGRVGKRVGEMARIEFVE